jgi:hypothetical protein
MKKPKSPHLTFTGARIAIKEQSETTDPTGEFVPGKVWLGFFDEQHKVEPAQWVRLDGITLQDLRLMFDPEFNKPL